MTKVRWTLYYSDCSTVSIYHPISKGFCQNMSYPRGKKGPTSLDKDLVLNQHLLKKYLRLDTFQSWFPYHKSYNLRVTSHVSRVIGRTDYGHIRLARWWLQGPIDSPSAMKILFTLPVNGGWIYPDPRAAMAMIIISVLSFLLFSFWCKIGMSFLCWPWPVLPLLTLLTFPWHGEGQHGKVRPRPNIHAYNIFTCPGASI